MYPTVSQYAEVLEELSKSATAEQVTDITDRFLGFLRHRGEQKKIGAIMKYAEKAVAQKEGRVSVAVVTAYEVTEDDKQKLSRAANRLFPEKKVELKYAVDRAVIGGALFSTDEMLYDATLATRLRALKNVL